jgi:hypothetical protein
MENKNFLLADDEGNNIAVISKKDKATPGEFNKAVELAIKEHFIADEVKIDRHEDAMKFDADTEEEGEKCIRTFTLEEIVIY